MELIIYQKKIEIFFYDKKKYIQKCVVKMTEMKYIVGDYCISLEPLLGCLFSLTVKDNRHFSTYKCNMPFKLFAKDKEQFVAVMKKFFEGAYLMKIEEDYTLKIEKYVFQIEKDANGLNCSFKLVVNEIVIKDIYFTLTPFHRTPLVIEFFVFEFFPKDFPIC